MPLKQIAHHSSGGSRFVWAFCCLLVFIFLPIAPVFAQTSLTILHTSEHHGALQPLDEGPYRGHGGVARRSTLIKDVRKEVEHTLLVDSGDILMGSAMSALFRGEADIAAMNLMGYDALGLGNHDFDFGVAHLVQLQKQAKFPFLCTNIRPRNPEACKRYVIKPMGTVRVVLIGLIGKRNFPDTFNRAALQEIEFQDPIEAARAAVAELREQAELFVAITHQETDEDLALARAIPALDVIIGGHTSGFDGLVSPAQSAPESGRVELAGGGPIFVKTHRQGRTLGRLDLLYHDRTIMVAEARNLPVGPSLSPDAALSQLLNQYEQRLETETSRIVGETVIDWEGETDVIRRRETNLGKLLADLARRETGAEIALLNAGAIRGGISAGPVPYRRLIEILPFETTLTKLVLTGAEIRAALEHSVSLLPQSSGRYLQVSGLEYTLNPAGPVGARIQEVKVNAAPLDAVHRYSVAVTRFLAEGGDGYGVFLRAGNRQDYETPLRELLANALRGRALTPEEKLQTSRDQP